MERKEKSGILVQIHTQGITCRLYLKILEFSNYNTIVIARRILLEINAAINHSS